MLLCIYSLREHTMYLCCNILASIPHFKIDRHQLGLAQGEGLKATFVFQKKACQPLYHGTTQIQKWENLTVHVTFIC